MENLLQTKFHIPQPNPRVVIRSHLLSRMDEGLAMGCKLALLCAPVGYGKSTFVSSWLPGVGCPAAWLSLDEMDNDPVRFWTYVVAALQTAQPELGQATLKLLQEVLTKRDHIKKHTMQQRRLQNLQPSAV